MPVLASYKVDGIRATVTNGDFVSRSGKPFKNLQIPAIYSHVMHLLHDIDGEWASGSPSAFNCMQATTSCVNSYNNSTDELCFYAFDLVVDNIPANERYSAVKNKIEDLYNQFPEMKNRIKVLEKRKLYTWDEINEFESEALTLGYEGIMIQDFSGKYKYGRASVKSQELLKIKQFSDSEAKIIGFYEGKTNKNEEEKDAFGHTTRSSKKEFIENTGTLGGFIAIDIHSGEEIRIGSGRGLTHELRQEIWDNQEEYIGKLAKYKFFKVGVVNAPRFPIFIGFRDPTDL